MNKNKTQNLLDEYAQSRALYEEFASRLKTILEEILNIEKCRFVFVESRCKQPESLKRKLEIGTFTNLKSVNDLAGVRITTYVQNDIEKIEELLPKVFDTTSLKVDERLGTDKVGYRSHHWLLKLPESRLKLPEYKRFSNLKAELQIRTILQHAWAQIGHNQIYKPSALLPEKIKRDFSLLSGLLEIADNEFSRISKEISVYSNEVNEKTSKGELDIIIDSLSLRSFMKERFGNIDSVEQEFGPLDNMTEDIIKELNLMEIKTLAHFNSIIPNDINEVIRKEPVQNFCSISRLIMIVHNPDLYFKKAWKKSWTTSESDANQEYSHYGINLNSLVSKYEGKRD